MTLKEFVKRAETLIDMGHGDLEVISAGTTDYGDTVNLFPYTNYRKETLFNNPRLKAIHIDECE